MNRRGFVSGALALGAAACGKPAARAPTVFEGELGALTGELLAESPELALRAGEAAKAGAMLDDRSAGAVDLRRAAALRRLAQWRSLDRTPLAAGERTTYDALDAYLAALAAGARFGYGRFSAADGFSPYALGPEDSATIRAQYLLALAPAPKTLDEASRDLALLRAIPAALDAEAALARADAQQGVTPPDFVLDRALAAVASVIEAPPESLRLLVDFRRRLEAIAGPIAPEAGPDTPPRARARTLFAEALAATAQQIQPAYRRTWGALAALRERAGSAPGIARLPQGAAAYRARLAFHASTNAAPEEIHAIGLARVQAAAGQLDMMLRSQGLAEGTPGARLAQLAADPRFRYPDDPVNRALADIAVYQRRVLSQLPRWFSGPYPDLPPMRADAAPGQLGAYEPPSLDNRRGGAVYFAAAMLAARPRFDLATISHHIALPGHHLQASAALARAELPALRRLLRVGASREGWATYGEQLADELGLYEGDPLSRIGYLRFQAWRAAQLVVDTGIHAMDWSREQASAYLTSVTGESAAIVDAEIARHAASPGAACAYELGRLALLQQRERARAALGQAFDSRAFHAAVLNEAELPPGVLADCVSSWIAKRGGG
ncbi:MAG: DUF885 family protein [Hyphomonadaceae bacterium]